MSSLARRHRAFALAQMAVAAAAAVGAPATRASSGAEATEYELQRARLGQDLAALREIQSREAKIARKREMLPAYDPWVQGVVEAAATGGRGIEDDVVVQTMIWALDCGDYERALPRAAYVIRWGLPMPGRFTSTAGCFIAEQTAENAAAARSAGEPFDLDVLLQVEDLTADADMHDQVRAKLAKEIGLRLSAAADAIEPGADGPAGGRPAAIEAALRKLRRALELDGKVGVKKEIERLERAQRKAPESAGGGTDG